jgi:flagellar biosynthesis protein FliQ
VTTTYVIQIAREAMVITLLLSAPMLGIGLFVGLIISILQAVTQINEMTLTFVPKIIAIVLAFIFFLPWILQLLMDFTVRLITSIPKLTL